MDQPKFTKPFKNGNSLAFRITKKDRQQMNITTDEEFVKKVSNDGNTISFTRVKKIRPEVNEAMVRLFNENRELMDRLENE